MQKTALITGASSDIGKRLIEKLSQKNCEIFAISREKIVFGKKVVNLNINLENPGEIEKKILEISKRLNKIDFLVNIAGITIAGPTLDFSIKDFEKILSVNTIAPFALIKSTLPLLKKAKRGRVVNITSINGLISLPNFGLYSASKHALNALGTSLFYELHKEGIFVTNIAPGAIEKKDSKTRLPHKPAREKFILLKYLMPMLTSDFVAEKILEVLFMENPPPSIILGNDAKILLFLKRFLPDNIWTRLMLYVWEKE